jgi:hypothetical protein
MIVPIPSISQLRGESQSFRMFKPDLAIWLG